MIVHLQAYFSQYPCTRSYYDEVVIFNDNRLPV